MDKFSFIFVSLLKEAECKEEAKASNCVADGKIRFDIYDEERDSEDGQ